MGTYNSKRRWQRSKGLSAQWLQNVHKMNIEEHATKASLVASLESTGSANVRPPQPSVHDVDEESIYELNPDGKFGKVRVDTPQPNIYQDLDAFSEVVPLDKPILYTNTLIQVPQVHTADIQTPKPKIADTTTKAISKLHHVIPVEALVDKALDEVEEYSPNHVVDRRFDNQGLS